MLLYINLIILDINLNIIYSTIPFPNNDGI